MAKTCSMGLRSGEYLGRKTRRAPTSRIARRTALPLWDPRLSRMTTSPGLRVGTRNCSQYPSYRPPKTQKAVATVRQPSQKPVIGGVQIGGRRDLASVRKTPIFSTRSSATLGQRLGSDDGLRSGLIDIPFAAGQAAFEDLHGYRDEEAFVDELNRLTKENCGSSLEFLEWQEDFCEWEPGEQVEFFRAGRCTYHKLARDSLTSTKRILTPPHGSVFDDLRGRRFRGGHGRRSVAPPRARKRDPRVRGRRNTRGRQNVLSRADYCRADDFPVIAVLTCRLGGDQQG